MLTDEQIKAAIAELFSDDYQPEHYDCVRIAYEWLDAQYLLHRNGIMWTPLKGIIERWGGRYVSSKDVCIAASIHPDVFGEYPKFNLPMNLTFPSKGRLSGIKSAGTQTNYDSAYDIKDGVYARFEELQ